jgi:peptidoglycan hydrolase FlgJ
MLTSTAALVSTTSTSTVPAATAHKLRQQAEDLEGVFLNTLFKEIFSSLKSDESAMGGGFAEETWRGIQAERMSDAVAADGGVGIAHAIYTDLLAVQERAQSAAASGYPPHLSTNGYRT